MGRLIAEPGAPKIAPHTWQLNRGEWNLTCFIYAVLTTVYTNSMFIFLFLYIFIIW